MSTDSSGSEDESIDQKMPPTNNTNAKLPGRQTNNSLSSLTGNIFIPPFETGGRTDSAASGGGGDASSASGSSESNQSSRDETPPAQPSRKKKTKASDV